MRQLNTDSEHISLLNINFNTGILFIIMSQIDQRYLLFFSIDIVDSSKIKNDSECQWIPAISEFLQGTHAKFQDNLISIGIEDEKLNEKLKLWKTIGDEVLFYFEAEKNTEVLKAVKAFQNTITDMNKPNNKKNSMLYKGTVWGGHIPYYNTQIETADRIDFLGRAVDAGFRLSKIATKRKLIIALDVLWLCCKSIIELEKGQARDEMTLDIYYEGKSTLKGVFNDKYTPIFWIDSAKDRKNKYPDEWRGRVTCDHRAVVDYLTLYLREHPVLFCYNFSKIDKLDLPKDFKDVCKRIHAYSTETKMSKDKNTPEKDAKSMEDSKELLPSIKTNS